MSSTDSQIILEGTYTSMSGIKLPYAVSKTNENLFMIEFDGISAPIQQIFPTWRGHFLM